MKKVLRWGILAVALALETMGVLSLLYIMGVFTPDFLSFYTQMRLILRYVVAIVFMAAGILTFSVFAGMFEGKVRNGLSIGGCVYSTILTLPLLYVFVGLFMGVNGLDLLLVKDVVGEFVSIFKTPILQYTIFALGIVMSLIFIAVPMITTILTVKEKSLSDLFRRDKMDGKHFEEI